MRSWILVFLFLCTSSSFAEKVDMVHFLPQQDDIVIGNSEAKNVIIEYSSLSCPMCGYFHANIFPKIKEKYLDTQKVKFVFRNYPIKPVDLKAGAVALCVPLDKRSVFLEVLFKTQRNWSVEASQPVEMLESIARLGGIKGEVIKNCLESKDVEARLVRIREYAQKEMEINSTPTFLINGKKFNGIIDMDIIDRELSS